MSCWPVRRAVFPYLVLSLLLLVLSVWSSLAYAERMPMSEAKACIKRETANVEKNTKDARAWGREKARTPLVQKPRQGN